MTHLNKMAVTIASLALIAGASTASAQSLSQGGQLVTAEGALTQNVLNPGGPDLTTVCAVEIYGQVATDGSNITFDDYSGTNVSGGPLA